jgi:hypothetical protein
MALSRDDERSCFLLHLCQLWKLKYLYLFVTKHREMHIINLVGTIFLPINLTKLKTKTYFEG